MPDEPRRIEQGLLTIRSEPQDAHFVSLHGELDGATAKELEAEFIRIEATSVSRIVLDLKELDFIDSTGLAVIMRANTATSSASCGRKGRSAESLDSPTWMRCWPSATDKKIKLVKR